MPGPDFQRIFEALPSPHVVLDRDLNFVAANSAYERATMRRRDELIGRGMFELFPNSGEGERRLRASFARVFSSGKPDTLAYIPYDIPNPDVAGEMEQRFWTAVHTPIPDEQGSICWLVQNTTDVTDLVRLRAAASLPFRSGAEQLLQRAQEAEQQHQALLDESADFRRLFQQAPGFFAVLSGADHVFTFANDAFLRLVGERSVIGMSAAEALPEIVEQGYIDLLNGVYGSGAPASGEAVSVLLASAEDDSLREKFVDFSYDAIRSREGEIIGVFVQGMDRTEAVRTLKRQRLLLDELNHRVKNTLATVQSIASQTLRSASDLKSARADFEARIISLSKAHNLLSVAQWSSARLNQILDQELAAYAHDGVVTHGPAVLLSPKASIALALVFHELATNALKFGALSAPEGRLDVSWRLDGHDGPLTIEWTESGGPEAGPPAHKGLGSRMIDRVVMGELGGEIDSRYDAGGFACRIRIDGSSLFGRDERAVA